MVKKDVEINGLYRMKVSNKITTVRIDRESPHGGWLATNVATNRQVRVRTAGKLRGKATAARLVAERIAPKGATAHRYTRATREALASNDMSTERGPKLNAESFHEAVVSAVLGGTDESGVTLGDALDTAISYLGDFIYNGAESGQRDEVDACIGRLSVFLNDHK